MRRARAVKASLHRRYRFVTLACVRPDVVKPCLDRVSGGGGWCPRCIQQVSDDLILLIAAGGALLTISARVADRPPSLRPHGPFPAVLACDDACPGPGPACLLCPDSPGRPVRCLAAPRRPVGRSASCRPACAVSCRFVPRGLLQPCPAASCCRAPGRSL